MVKRFEGYKYEKLSIATEEQNGVIDKQPNGQNHTGLNFSLESVDELLHENKENSKGLWSNLFDFLTCGACCRVEVYYPRYEHFQNSVTSKQYEELKNAFIAFDRNCDGFIDSEDLGYVMGKLGHDLSSKEVKKVFKDICKHSNGKMDFTDFVEMMAQDKLVLTTSEQEILAAFQFLDQNHDGYITIDELLQRFHGCLSDTEASRLMCEADANGDGKIDFNEFKHMMFNQERSISLAQSEVERSISLAQSEVELYS